MTECTQVKRYVMRFGASHAQGAGARPLGPALPRRQQIVEQADQIQAVASHCGGQKNWCQRGSVHVARARQHIVARAHLATAASSDHLEPAGLLPCC